MTYYVEMSYSRRKNKDISIRLKIDETVNVGENKSDFTITIQYKNTGNRITISDYGAEINVRVNSGETWYVGGSTFYLENTGNEWKDYPWYPTFTRKGFSHTQNGGGSFTVTAEFSAEKVLGIYATKGTINFTHDYELINQTAPTISSHAVKSNRYGRDTTFYLNASHSSYNLNAQLTIDGLTYEQATAHSGFSWYIGSVHVTSKSTGSNGSYSIIYDFEFNNKTVSGNWLINLISGAITDSKYYNSGQSYQYKLKVSAENNKGITVSGVMAVPQKVLQITCDSEIAVNLQGSAVNINACVLPDTSEEQGITYSSSDSEIATVDGNGDVTAVSEGVCVITAVSNDGGFVAECSATVTNGDEFPTLTEIRFLGVSEISKIETACKFLADSLGVELSLPTVAGRNQAVTQIKSIFEGIEDCCQTLRAAAISAGMTNLPIDEQRTISKSNTGGDWFFIVNGWIDLLNSINSQRS